jgi:hypothetical protein
MDRGAKLFKKSTPRLAKLISSKYSRMSAGNVTRDYEESRLIKLNRSWIQDLSSCVSDKMIELEQRWSYSISKAKLMETKVVGLSLDGTTTRIKSERYKETMCGTLSLYNSKGDRLHTIYLAVSPQKQKANFYNLLDREIALLKQKLPNATYVGIADGAKENWTYLGVHVSNKNQEILDYYHATEYLSKYAQTAIRGKHKKAKWYSKAKEILKEQKKGAEQILAEMKNTYQLIKGDKKRETIQSCITYFENNLTKMDYISFLKKGYPIGSGVTEAACKTIVKQRLSSSGMIWTRHKADEVLIARALFYTDQRWEQFWKKFDRYVA